MRRLVAVEHALLGDHDLVAVRAGVDHGRPDASAGALAGDDDGVDAQRREVAGDRRAPERARRRLLQEDLALDGRDLRDDVIHALALRAAAHVAGAPRVLAPGRRPADDAGLALRQAGDVDDGDAGLARGGQQALDVRQRLPGREPTAAGPFVLRLQHRLRLVAEHPAVEVDHQQRRPRPEPAGLVSARCNVLQVCLAQVLLPHALCHRSPPWKRMLCNAAILHRTRGVVMPGRRGGASCVAWGQFAMRGVGAVR